jgi:16S rRNA (cytosine967-C5)-methyltransferase
MRPAAAAAPGGAIPARWHLEPQDIAELVALQRRILESASRLVKHGGRLAYATCSLLRRENQAQIEWFLDSHPGFHLMPVAEVWRGVLGSEPPADAVDPNGVYLSLTPARHGTDGFFLAVLEREPKPVVAAEEVAEEAPVPEPAA